MAQQMEVLQRAGLAPSVNLLPPGVSDRRRLRKQRRTLLIAAAAVMALVLLLFYLEASRAGAAADRADDAEHTVASLQTEKASLQRYADLRDRLSQLEQQRTLVFKGEVRGSTVLEDFTRLVPKDVWLTQLSLTVPPLPDLPGAPAGQNAGRSTTTGPNTQSNGAPVPGAPGTGTATAGTPVASITFAGQALSHPDVAAFIKSLNETVKRGGQPIYVNPYYTSSTAGSDGDTVSFNGTVDLTAAAFSGRFQSGDATGGP